MHTQIRLLLYLVCIITLCIFLFIKSHHYIYILFTIFFIYLIILVLRHNYYIYLTGIFYLIYIGCIITIIVTCFNLYKKENRYIYLFIALVIISISFGIMYNKYRIYHYYKNKSTLLYTTADKTIHNLYTGWKEYRIGDIFRIYSFFIKLKKGNEYHLGEFSNSIATHYIKKSNSILNYTILEECIRESIYKEKPLQDYYIIHLRIGDVIDNTSYSVIDILSKPVYYTSTDIFNICYHNYAKPLRYYEEKVKLVQMNYPAIKTIVLVAGAHIPLQYEKSSLYINCISSYMKQHGYNVILRLARNPDEDLVYMSQASYFTPSGGGFSSIITYFVRKNDGIII